MAETSTRREPAGDPATLLRERGVQVTAQRIAVMRTISDHPHISAPDVVEAVRGQIGAISRQAVYDTLKVLTEHRLVRAIQPAGSPTRYEDRVGDNHHHLVCRLCDMLIDVDCATGEVPCLTPVDDWDFQIDEAEVIYWGICPECQAAAV